MLGGKVMDNFMDKIAHKFSAQELIKANAQAEAEEMKRLQTQITAYEEILQDIRRVNLKNVELSDKVENLLELCTEKTEALSVGNSEEAVKAVGALQTKLEEILQETQEHVHRECVKVYRNVQAVVVDELKNQTETIKEDSRKAEKRTSLQQPLIIITLLLSLANTVMLILNILGVV